MKIALASSSNRTLVDQTLHTLYLEEFFDFTVAGDEVEKRKQDPALYRRVLEVLGVEAGDALAVEDSRTGVASAQDAGIFCFGYRHDTSGKQDLSHADALIENLEEIMMRH